MIRNGKTVYVFEACGWDIFDRRDTPADGTLVTKTQPAGCPKNGTMQQHCFIADLDGNFIGLVSLGSLRKATKADLEAAA